MSANETHHSLKACRVTLRSPKLQNYEISLNLIAVAQEPPLSARSL